MSGQPQIRIAALSDSERIRQFIDRHWRKGHAFVQSPELFHWQHRDEEKGRINFLIAEDPNDQEILAILGFVPVAQFDPALGSQDDYWLAIWKVREDRPLPGLGMSLLYYLRGQFKPRSIASVGLSQMVIPIYKAMGYQVGQLNHHVFIHPSRRDFKILGGEAVRSPCSVLPGLNFEKITLENWKKLESQIQEVLSSETAAQAPKKSLNYLVNRYLKHPGYCYELRLATEDGKPIGLMVTRLLEAQGSSVIRIVDLFSSVPDYRFLGPACERVLKESGAEYADFYSFGFPKATLEDQGLHDVYGPTNLVVPNYFEPFERKNIKLDFAYKLRLGEKLPFRFVKGDSDQDRPNQLGGNTR